MQNFKPIIIICGHYGSGKTNLSMNLAIHLKKQGGRVRIIDLDIVNPYFRSSDYNLLLEKNGIEMIEPNLARTTLDVPSLPASIDAAFDSSDGYVIVDAGGDDAGATALGCFSKTISTQDYEMLYVINQNRELIADPNDALTVMREIEAASKLKCTALVNNTHLARFTDAKTIADGMEYAEKVSDTIGLPVKLTCFARKFEPEFGLVDGAFPIDVLVTTPWDKEESN